MPLMERLADIHARHIRLLPPGQEVKLSELDLEVINSIRVNLVLAQSAADRGDIEFTQSNVHGALSGVKLVFNRGFLEDKVYLLDHVIEEIKKPSEFADKSESGYSRGEILEDVAELKTMREQVAQHQAPARDC